MTHTTDARFKTHLPLMCLLVLALASPASTKWKEKMLYSLQGGRDGYYPAGGVVFDNAGTLYGATNWGGDLDCSSDGCGTVFAVSPHSDGSWKETIVYAFRGVGGDPKDGFTPAGSVIIDQRGNLYGTTSMGGDGPCFLLGSKAGCGTVYELSPPALKGGAWTETILYSFQGGNDGYFPWGNLVFDKAGNLYGATQFGGGKGTTCDYIYGGQCGTVFKLSPPEQKGGKWTEIVLHRFAGGTDGANPNGGLVLDDEGAIYGTTFGGGYNCPHHSGLGCGTVFKLDAPSNRHVAWKEEQLLVFKNGVDGAQPIAGVILGAEGSIYGAAEGGTNGCGLVFRLTANGGGRWKDAVLYGFGGSQYYYSPAVAILDKNGNLYGTTNVGPGQSLSGSVYRLTPPKQKADKWTFTILYGFRGTSDGAQPTASLVFDRHGNMYSTTQIGGTGDACTFGCGTVFEVSP